MATPDLGHKLTDRELTKLEKRISSVYSEAAKDLQKTIDDYFAKFAERDKHQQGLLDAGKITKEQYKQWRLAQIGRGERFEALRDQIAERMTKANQTAVSYVNDATPGIYSLNRNYAAYTIEQVAGDVGFNLWDEQTVKRLIVEQPDLMPYYPAKRAVNRGIDLAYGKKQITASVTSSILQGKSIKGMADDLQTRIPTMNRDSAIRTARTAVTGAQNAGRQDSYIAAEKMGIELKREWVCTLDARTREEHARADGQVVGVDEPFTVGGEKLMYPGDRSGSPWNIYNCRCTVIARVKGAPTASQRIAKDPETGQNVVVSDMTYSEWSGWNVEKSCGLSSDTFLVSVGASPDEISKMKEALTYEQAQALVGAQEGLSYRAYAKESGMSSFGHAMFADSTDMLDVYGGGDPKWFSVSETQLTDINSLKKSIIDAREKTVKGGNGLLDYENLSDDEFFEMFNPSDIVMSAEAFDDEELTGWLWENVLEPKGIAGVKTADGAVVYDNSIMVRNLPMEVYTKGKTETSVIEEAVEAAKETAESAEMKEYLSFKLEMEKKYGADAIWGSMSDPEYDKLERLERIAYTGK